MNQDKFTFDGVYGDPTVSAGIDELLKVADGVNIGATPDESTENKEESLGTEKIVEEKEEVVKEGSPSTEEIRDLKIESKSEDPKVDTPGIDDIESEIETKFPKEAEEGMKEAARANWRELKKETKDSKREVAKLRKEIEELRKKEIPDTENVSKRVEELEKVILALAPTRDEEYINKVEHPYLANMDVLSGLFEDAATEFPRKDFQEILSSNEGTLDERKEKFYDVCLDAGLTEERTARAVRIFGILDGIADMHQEFMARATDAKKEVLKVWGGNESLKIDFSDLDRTLIIDILGKDVTESEEKEFRDSINALTPSELKEKVIAGYYLNKVEDELSTLKEDNKRLEKELSRYKATKPNASEGVPAEIARKVTEDKYRDMPFDKILSTSLNGINELFKNNR